MELKFINLLNTGVYSNTDIPSKPRGLRLGLLIYHMYKAVYIWVVRCCYYAEWRKAMKQADCFSIKTKEESDEQTGSSRY